MILFPAIDLKGGKCVRLLRGEMESATVYNDDPGAQAIRFQQAGFRWLHIVDLDGAVGGRSQNAPTVNAIIRNVTCPVQLGGGIRDLAAIESWLEAGVTRVILGTVALTNPELVKAAAHRFANQIVVGIDAKNGMVAVQGWVHTSDTRAVTLAQRFEDAGVAAIIYTDIARDGTGLGLNIEETAEIASAVSIPVIASGGVGSLDDLRALKSLGHPNIHGVVCGRALYDGRIDPHAALRLLEA